ncbi:hypothetical protein Bca52824_083009 [Brassica carinata]|uniref:Uncharacterized protein n=3 Tax=Brassica TaxID=3705 RepID=A0A0D3CWD9_BRAOL|nr:hypothetical protein Bca52824_083009 [Brassica carinata]VDD62888.1 unnamed protein product [Brassica oleracea]
MITRSNLAEQLREYQIRSKHDWASVSFFSSTSNFSSSRFENYTIKRFEICVQHEHDGPCRGLCHLGAGDLTTPGVFSSILVLQAVATSIHPGLCQLAFALLYENYKASENS